MNKDEALWVVIRAAGIVFLVLALVHMVKLVSMFGYYVYVSDVFSVYDSMTDSLDGKKVAISTAKAMFSQNLSNVLLYGISSYYFMRKGRFVHNVISK